MHICLKMCPRCITWLGKRVNQKTKKQPLRKKCSQGTITQGKRYIIAHWITYTSICFLITALIFAGAIQESGALILYLVPQERRALQNTIGPCPTSIWQQHNSWILCRSRECLQQREEDLFPSLRSSISDNPKKFTGPSAHALKFLLLNSSSPGWR